MHVRKTRRILAAAALFTLMAGAASASTPKPAMPSAAVPPQFALAQPVMFLISTASLEEYSRSDPADRTEITRSAVAQRPTDHKAASSGTARS